MPIGVHLCDIFVLLLVPLLVCFGIWYYFVRKDKTASKYEAHQVQHVFPQDTQQQPLSSLNTPLRNEPDTPGSGAGQTLRHWEYHDFVEEFDMKSSVVYGSRPTWERGLPEPSLRWPIERAAERLLKRVSPYGWEPMEPIDADSLWEKGHVLYQDRSALGEHIASTHSIEVWGVRMTFRRMRGNKSFKDETRG